MDNTQCVEILQPTRTYVSSDTSNDVIKAITDKNIELTKSIINSTDFSNNDKCCSIFAATRYNLEILKYLLFYWRIKSINSLYINYEISNIERIKYLLSLNIVDFPLAIDSCVNWARYCMRDDVADLLYNLLPLA